MAAPEHEQTVLEVIVRIGPVPVEPGALRTVVAIVNALLGAIAPWRRTAGSPAIEVDIRRAP